jgi:hypothetical protein
MNLLSSSAYVLVAVAIATPLMGCSVTIEPATRFEGSDENASVAYVDGNGIRVSSANGNLEVVSTSGSDVTVQYSPFIFDKADNEENARDHMENNLTFVAEESGGVINIQVLKADGSKGDLGADMLVGIPSGFNGTFELDQGNGGTDVDLPGAPSSVDIFSDNGGLVVSLASFAPGKVTNDGAGDVEVYIPASSDGIVTALTDGGVGVVTSDPGADWVPSEENGDQAQTFTMGAGAGGTLDILGGFDVHVGTR